MELKDVISSRRSIRKFKEDLINEDIIMDAIRYGIMAPSAHNRQPWKVKLVKGEEKDKIADILYDKTIDIVGHTGPHTAGVIKSAPYLLLVFLDNINESDRDMDVLSIGGFVENILLYLTDLDMGNLWIGNTNIISDEIKELLNINYESISSIAIGVKDQDPKARPRKEFEEIIL